MEKLHWLNFWAMGIEKKHFWVENGLIHWEQQRMSGEFFNETDNKFYIFYFGQQGLWAQGPRDLEKWSKNGNLWVKNVKIFFAQYADDAHRCALMRM